MNLCQRLEAMAQRRDMEGIYTDGIICRLAIQEIQTLRQQITVLRGSETQVGEINEARNFERL